MNNIKSNSKNIDINSPRITVKDLLDNFICDEETIIRIGVNIAEEEAKKESARRRINAPLTVEEKIFFLKSNRIKDLKKQNLV